MTAQRVVWIDDGCCGCHACQTTCPEVFVLPEGTAQVAGTVRMVGATDENALTRSPLLHALLVHLPEIEAAIEGCPVEVIHLA